MNPMNIDRMSLAAVAALLVFAPACSKEKTPAACQGAQLPASMVVATYKGGQVTGADLDKDPQVKSQLKQVEQQLYDARRQAAQQMALQAIVKQEAQKQGLDQEGFFKKEIEDKVPPPTDAEIQQFYNKANEQHQLPPGMTPDKAKGQIVQILTRQARQDKARELFSQLEKQYDLKVNLPEPAGEVVNVEAKGPARGPESAKVTIVEFSDFQCPYCSRAEETVDKVMQDYAGKVRLVYRQFPLSFHPHAEKAAEASLCAKDQGKFWEMHDAMFKNQQKLEVADLKQTAKSLGLDSAKFDNCLDSGEKAQQVQSDQKAGEEAGVNGTPAFFINGHMLSGAQPYDEFKKLIDEQLNS